jgi:hypothetical protein
LECVLRNSRGKEKCPTGFLVRLSSEASKEKLLPKKKSRMNCVALESHRQPTCNTTYHEGWPLPWEVVVMVAVIA